MTNQSASRRGFLKGAAGAAVATVIGFSRNADAWVTSHGGGSDFDRVPRLDGELLTDQAARELRGQDLGNTVFNVPAAVLIPGSIQDVERMVAFCAKRRIVVAARGQGHATFGQAQARAGLVIDMATLSNIYEVGEGYAVVGAGLTWRRLLEETLLHGQTPPVLTGFIGLSIGGTLSMGGISGMAYNKGVQVQHVRELLVVTGKGKLERCSERRNRELFEAVLAGQGQCGIIVQATLVLIPAEERATDLVLRYNDVERFNDDLRTLVYRNELDMVWGGANRDASGWFYEINTTSFYTPPAAPDIAFLTRGLSYEPGSLVQRDGTYLEFQTRVDGLIELVRSLGAFDGVMHPWFDVFVPDSQLASYVDDIVSSLAPDDVGNFGFILIFPLLTSTITRPLFRLPDEELVYLFDVLTSADFPGFDAAYASRMADRNRAWYEKARAFGGTRYPIGTLDFTRADWRAHYGPVWRRFEAAKKRFDPQRILTPGPGIFRR